MSASSSRWTSTLDLNDWGEFNEVDLEQESEEAGPPDVSDEMLAQLELEADEREISRLKEMGFQRMATLRATGS